MVKVYCELMFPHNIRSIIPIRFAKNILMGSSIWLKKGCGVWWVCFLGCRNFPSRAPAEIKKYIDMKARMQFYRSLKKGEIATTTKAETTTERQWKLFRPLVFFCLSVAISYSFCRSVAISPYFYRYLTIKQ